MASLLYTGTTSQTTAYAASDIYTLAIPTTSVTSVSQQGNNVVIQTGATALTITGVTLAQLATSNFALQGGGNVIFGDGSAATLADAFGNEINGSATAGDILLGLGGNDSITAGAGANLIYGGSGITDPNDGNDTIRSGNGNDTIYGNGGDDIIGGAVGGAAIQGNAALVGNSGSDLIFGGIGADQIAQQTLGGQNTSVYGGGGFTDTVDGADIINIQNAGTLFVTGNAGNDIIVVDQTAGSSSVYGGLGNDSITVNVTTAASNTFIAGGSADADTIVYNATGVANTNATIFGGTGGTTDTVDGADNITINSAGNTVVYANAGNDTVTATLTGTSNTQIFAGIGNDTVNVTINGTGSAVGQRANVTITGGTADSDVITIAAASADYNATIFGGVGINDAADLADTIIGGAGNEVIYGNGGADRLITGAGDDQLFGGAGADVFLVNGAGNKIIADLNAGGTADTLLVSGALGTPVVTGVGPSGFTLSGTLGVGNPAINIAVQGSITGTTTIGVDANNNFALDAGEARYVIGTNTGTALTGTAGAQDSIFGGAGNDTITGTTGGAGGNDALFGGAGNDTFNVTAANLGIIDGGIGSDTVNLTGGAGAAGNGNAFGLGNVSNIEVLNVANDGSYYLTVGGDQVAATGTTLVVNGGALTGQNVLSFTGTGETSAISVTGGAAADTIVGGAGADTIVGGGGADSLTGGAGIDTFRFAAGDTGTPSGTTFDVITDLNTGGNGIIDYTTAITFQAGGSTANAGTAAIAANGVATFNGGDTTVAQQLAAVSAAITLGGNTAGESAFFVNNGATYLFISDGVDGVGANDVFIQLTGSFTNSTLTNGDLSLTA